MNEIKPRTFEDKPAVREHVPLLIGLMGPSGGGKTFSALRLATGIQQITGGDIYGIDTEARRMLHYADIFRFRHQQFDEPYGSLDYLAAIRHAVGKGGKVIIVDSMSHEHSGVGGYLDFHEREVERMSGTDAKKADRVQIAGWIKPAQARKQMIDGILHLNANFIFCFRAKEKIKPVPGKEPIELGWMPIAGDELMFEMTVACLLLPKAGGVPTWRSDNIGERLMMKLPERFAALFPTDRPIGEETGAELAKWARGEKIGADLDDLPVRAATAARGGKDAFRDFWRKLPPAQRAKLSMRLEEYREMADKADRASEEDPFATVPGWLPGVGEPSASGADAVPPQVRGSLSPVEQGATASAEPRETAEGPQGSPPAPEPAPPAVLEPANANGRQRAPKARQTPNGKPERDERRDALEHEGQNHAESGFGALQRWLDNLDGDDSALISHRAVSRWQQRARDVDADRRRGK